MSVLYALSDSYLYSLDAPIEDNKKKKRKKTENHSSLIDESECSTG